MALKGFLASGFQKLIGASRIKGANDKFLGEYNKQSTSATTFPIAITLVDGMNYLDWAPTSGLNYTGAQLFTNNPTTNTLLTIQNNAISATIQMTGATPSVGGLRLRSPCVLNRFDTISFIWDGTNFVEIGRTLSGPVVRSVAQSTASIANSDVTGSDVTLLLTASAALTVTSIQGNQSVEGSRLTLIGSSTTKPITIQQDTAASPFLVLNGDCILTPFSSLTLVYCNAVWVETSRNMVGGY